MLASAVLLVSLGLATAQHVKCTPPTTFEARGLIDIHAHGREVRGFYAWAHDMKVDKALLEARMEHGDFDIWFLEDFPAHHRYEEDSKSKECHVKSLNGTLENAWEWLHIAHYDGERVIHHRGKTITVHIWKAELPGGDQIETGCEAKDPSRPLFLNSKYHGFDRFMAFDFFFPEVRNQTIFKPLKNCPV
eukprot:NODE_1623_length_1352_cov_119.359939_g1344_i0.p1 GENE.NODE_1623_length_1352_cov_119.359939_g1344_i0~~NODE_1623_length_1352_cov_119.359939_g1344_i0.p1  ORF type:complete len:190 (+),score=77.33 NODE_1623_length_1352_cov_119.359939_g1344_i0:539-1108(+)